MRGAINAAASYMMVNPANVAKEKARFMAATTVTALDLQTKNALQVYTRPRGTVVWPAYSEVIE
jgi:hypothetical protein